MNVKYILLISMLIFLTLSTVSAEDNVTSDILTSSDSDVNVTFDEQMWRENLTDIHVELPEDSEGDFCIKIDDEVMYNESITNRTFDVPVKLPKRLHEFYISVYPPIDCRPYKISAFLNGVDLNINKTLKVMTYPPDYNIMHFPEEILHNDPYMPLMVFPRSANGTVELYIDDKLFNRTTARPVFYWKDNPFSTLPLGNHAFRVVYYGDSYYKPFNRTFNFTVTDVVIQIPEIINIGHDDCVSVRTSDKAQGTVKVFIDGALIKTSKTEDGDFIMSLEQYIKYTNHEVKVVYTSKNLSRTKIQQVNMTYDFDVLLDYFTYGDMDTLEILLPDTLNNKLLTVTVNGTKYTFRHSAGIVNNIIEIDISKLLAGNYTLNIDFQGDDKFYPLNKSYNFTIDYNFKIPWFAEYKGSSVISLNLPKDANGQLVVYVDGKLFKSSRMNNGYAEVRMDSLAPGVYDMSIRYDGNDYSLDSVDTVILATPKVTAPYKFRAGENKYVKLEVPKTCKGYVIFEIDGKRHKVAIKNGIAKYSLKNLKPGEHEIYAEYYGADGYEDLSGWVDVTVKKPLVKLTLNKVKIKKSAKKLVLKATLKVNGKKVKGKVVKFKFNKKTYKIKTNKKGIAKLTITKKVLKKLKVGKKVTYKASYGGKTVKKTVRVK